VKILSSNKCGLHVHVFCDCVSQGEGFRAHLKLGADCVCTFVCEDSQRLIHISLMKILGTYFAHELHPISHYICL